MKFFVGVFLIALLLIIYGYYIGKYYTIKQAKEKGLQDNILEKDYSKEDKKKYKYF